MECLESQVVEKLRILPSSKQQEVLDFIEFLIARAIPRGQGIETSQKPTLSFTQAAHQYIGCVEGPGDLSTNANYMEGYGQ